MLNRVCDLFSIKYPIVQAGMVWCSGWELASAVSNAGGLGLIGSGSMDPETLRLHIRKAKSNTKNHFGVNIPLLYSHADEIIKIVIDEQVPVVFTSAGNPAKYTATLKDKGIKVAHVVANCKFAQKSIEAGVDAIVVEGVEAGGHNGREETTTLVLLQLVKQFCNLPVIAAGGISTGKSMAAVFALGAEGIQVGSRFAACTESSAHDNFKNKIIEVGDGDTRMALRKLTPVRLIKNELSRKLEEAESTCSSNEEVLKILGRGRSKLGMFDGDLVEGELEIGQIAALIKDIKPAAEIINDIINEYNVAINELKAF